MSGEADREKRGFWEREKPEEKGETSGKWARREIRKELVRKSKVEDKTKGTILRQTSSSFTLRSLSQY